MHTDKSPKTCILYNIKLQLFATKDILISCYNEQWKRIRTTSDKVKFPLKNYAVRC